RARPPGSIPRLSSTPPPGGFHMRSKGYAVLGALAVGLVATAGASHAQHPVEGTEWTLHTLRPFGQPVIPVFEGWWENPDGTFGLCYGYHNLNLEQALEIPLGPDNFIEPRQFDGMQPTHFAPIPSK